MFFIVMSFIVFVVLDTFNAAFLHFGVAANVSVGETTALDEENPHSKQEDCNSHQNYGQKKYLHDFILKKACKFKKGF